MSYNINDAGYTTGGVGKNTPASNIQSNIGNVQPGSGFGQVQSLGARGQNPPIGAVGFGSGIQGGTPASNMQSNIGNVPKGSGFSNLQSAGARK